VLKVVVVRQALQGHKDQEDPKEHRAARVREVLKELKGRGDHKALLVVEGVLVFQDQLELKETPVFKGLKVHLVQLDPRGLREQQDLKGLKEQKGQLDQQ